MSLAAQDAIWLRRLLNSLEIKQSQPAKLYEDNQGSIALSKNPHNHSRTKHIDVKYHFIRETVQIFKQSKLMSSIVRQTKWLQAR